MRYYTIKRKFFLTDDNFIFHWFGLDGENKEYIITNLNFESLENYIADITQEDELNVSPFSNKEKKKLLKTLEEIEKSLNDFDEIQIKKE